MISFRFLDDAYYIDKQNYKSLTIRDLYADIILDSTIIGQIQCYYLNSYLLDSENLDLIQVYLNTLDKEKLDLYYNEGFYDEDDYEKFSEEKFFNESEYESFLDNNNLEKIEEYIRNKNDMLFIKELKLNNPHELNSIIKELKYTLYLLFDYKDFIIMDSKESIIE